MSLCLRLKDYTLEFMLFFTPDIKYRCLENQILSLSIQIMPLNY